MPSFRAFVRLAAVLAFAALPAPAPAAAQVAKLLPVDQGARDPSFARFREQLREAVLRRDTAYLYSIVASDVLNGFGGEGGLDEFRETWDPAHPASGLWITLGEVLRLGGAFVSGDTLFGAPYVYSSFPAAYDAFEHGAVVGASVRVRGAPRQDAPVIAALSHDVVRLANERGSNGWTTILLADGRKGYVAARFVRRPVDYRAVFVKRGGRWWLKALVAGD